MQTRSFQENATSEKFIWFLNTIQDDASHRNSLIFYTATRRCSMHDIQMSFNRINSKCTLMWVMYKWNPFSSTGLQYPDIPTPVFNSGGPFFLGPTNNVIMCGTSMEGNNTQDNSIIIKCRDEIDLAIGDEVAITMTWDTAVDPNVYMLFSWTITY